MWYDSHCHVSAPRFEKDRTAVLARAREGGVSLMIDIGCERPSWPLSLALSAREPDVYSSLGLHPHEAVHWNTEAAAELEARLSDQPRICAIGEMGLDYYYEHSPRAVQQRAFHAQLEIAERLALPAVFHIRDAYEDAEAILAEHPRVQGIVHCFTGAPCDAARFLAQGHAVSFSGILTYKTATQVQEAAKIVPLDRILVETDAPYLSPDPMRGRRNEPGFVPHTGAFLARLIGLPVADLARRTRENTERFFRLRAAG